jgi:predicted Zn-dependent protease
MLETTASGTAIDEFKSGVRFLRDAHPTDALQHFRNAVAQEPQNPYYLSFLGLSTALAERDWIKALELCQDALRLKRGELQLHLNLVEVYVAANRLEEAVRALDAAEGQFGADGRIGRIRKRLGRRRQPVLQFLARGNFLNRKLGQLRHRLLGSPDRP